MKWDGAAYADDIRRGLFLLLTDMEKQKARMMSHKEFTEFFKNLHTGIIQHFGGIPLEDRFVPFRMDCKPEQIEFELSPCHGVWQQGTSDTGSRKKIDKNRKRRERQ